MPVQNKRRFRFLRLIRDRRGNAAIEFALVALPFFILAFGMLEVGGIFWGNYELDNLTKSAARIIRTGEAQKGSLTPAQVVSKVCGRAVVLTGCATKLKISVETFNNFASVAVPAATGKDGNLKKSFPYKPGGPSQIVLVASFYERQLFGPSSLALLSNLSNGNYLLQSQALVETEPYQ